ncbi:hypothetical protein [Anderseniella sp. Alg231-50]|uniref:hypothetical protein n=1 Tax=Anderseniella sp. Alg231-50 TaxID=1922226 RepID=UPI00307BFC93
MKNQTSYNGIELHHSTEKRDKEFSLDRLGRIGIEKKVVRFVSQRAFAAGGKFDKPREFNGWAVVRVSELLKARQQPKLLLVSSPVKNPEPDDNPYHAHAIITQDMTPHLAALHLRHIFTKHGCIEEVSNKIEKSSYSQILEKLVNWMFEKFGIK